MSQHPRHSNPDRMEKSRNLENSFCVELPAPSAILRTIESAALRNWDESPNISVFGNPPVLSLTSLVNISAFLYTDKSLNLCMFPPTQIIVKRNSPAHLLHYSSTPLLHYSPTPLRPMAILILLPASARAGIIAADLFADADGLDLRGTWSRLSLLTVSATGHRFLVTFKSGAQCRLVGHHHVFPAHRPPAPLNRNLLHPLGEELEDNVQRIVRYQLHQLHEHLECFGLVFHERIFLPVSPKMNPFLQVVH